MVIGIAREKGAPQAQVMLGRESEGGLRYAGSAFITLASEERQRFWRHIERNQTEASPVKGRRRKGRTVSKAGPVGRVRHLRGEELLRHATVRELIAV